MRRSRPRSTMTMARKPGRANHLLPLESSPAGGDCPSVWRRWVWRLADGCHCPRTLAASPPASTGDEPSRAHRYTHLLILAATFVLVPAGVWIMSHLGRALFINRYFISSVAGFAILYGHVFARLGRWATARGAWTTRRGRFVSGAAVALFAAVYVVWPARGGHHHAGRPRHAARAHRPGSAGHPGGFRSKRRVLAGEPLRARQPLLVYPRSRRGLRTRKAALSACRNMCFPAR